MTEFSCLVNSKKQMNKEKVSLPGFGILENLHYQS
ncbi:hypothetical protein PEDI_35510 [Persicobacter diffluens]|uniref:Uncharacterized protein n=1 Tax=Persicobacter diffluens TaxID=981 RepID=A0AAN4VZK5_9BACT|nr:hypothetical protein PEDI_35510 [Persicobacter diffluens]